MKTRLNKLDEVRSLFAKYHPRIYYSKNYSADIQLALIDCDEETLDDFIAFAKYCKKNGQETIIPITLQHDIGGLMSSDEHFIPRVSGYLNMYKLNYENNEQ